MTQFLLLRPEPKLTRTLQFLSEQSVDVQGLALQKVVSVSDQVQAFEQAQSHLDSGIAIIVTSTYAAEIAAPILAARKDASQLVCYAIGPATASVLKERGLTVRTPTRFDSEGLLEMAELIDVNDKTLWILKGVGGRQALEDELKSRGAQTVCFNLYQRQDNQDALDLDTLRQSSAQWVIATSAEQIDQCWALLGEAWCQQRYWVVVSERIKQHLLDKSVERVILADNASDQALLEAVLMAQMESAQEAQNSQSEAQEESNDTSDSVFEKYQSETPVSEPVEQHEQKNVAKAPSLGWIKFLLIVTFLLVLGLGGAAYWFWMQWQSLEQQREQQVQTQLEQSLAQQSLQLAQMEQALTSNVQQQVQQYEERLLEMSQQNSAVQKQLLEMAGQRPSDWMIAEANYLVKMAGRKMWLEHDLNTAILMLQSADARLAELDDPSLIPVRELIADDIQTLALVNDVPQTEIALKIGALAKQVSGLTLAMVDLPTPIEMQSTPTAQQDASWRDNLGLFWDNLVDDLITVTPRSEQVKPLMSQQQQWLIKQQLRQQLLQAQVAILREQSELYTSSLDAALQLLQQYFDKDTALYRQYEQALAGLLETDTSRYYPQKLSSADGLQSLLDQRMNKVVSEVTQ